MFKKLRMITSTHTWKQSQITILGTIINGGLGALFYVFIARFLGPVDFGLLTISITVITLISDIADFGVDTGIIRFVPSHLTSNKPQALKYLKLGLELKFIIWFLIMIIGYIAAPVVANNIFQKKELILPLRLSLLGIGSALLFSYATSVLQSFQKYFSWSVVNILSNLTRLVLIFLLFYSKQLGLTSGLIIYTTIPFLGFIIAMILLPTRQILSAKNEFNIEKDFFKFNFWVAAFTIISAISSRLDTFLNARLLSAQDIGIYGAANQLTQVIPQLVGALGVVAAPKFASFQTKTQMLKYFKKFQLLVLGISILIIIFLPLSYYIIPFLFGLSYLNAIMPFIILVLAMLVFLISVPVHNAIIFFFGRSDIFVWVSIVNLLIIGLLGVFMITNYGVVGTAITVLIGMLANFVIPLIWFLIKIKK